ncbi:MAG: hypothetical protein MI919_11980 [Holophagales bacterium]|nr:hypothetical protein [Holophagales bacterium]
MKKRKKKLSLRRETLRVEQVLGNVVGGWQTQQQNCNDPTDLGQASVCALCGTGVSGCNDNCTAGANCHSGNQCPDPTQTCDCGPSLGCWP